MKKAVLFIISLVFFVLSGSQVIAKTYYRTYEVVEVTEKTITLQRKSGDEVIKAVIERSRRPNLKVGDRVRYDRRTNRLRNTLKRE